MDNSTEDITAHMQRVQAAERDLRELGMVWRTIESAASISCPREVAPILPTLVGTRERFEGLQQRLIQQMAHENREALGDELLAKAQCTIDILVRNLYERTADVGFLATDESVVQFCSASAEARTQGHAALRARLAEYQAKYSVYDDLILLRPDGELLARLDERQPLARSQEPLLAQAVSTHGHVERYGATDLQIDGGAALLFAHRIHDPHGRTVGVLVMRFRFGHEMSLIFDSMADERQAVAIVLLGEDQRVVSSNDEAHVPPGARLQPVAPGGVRLTTFAGREYLAVCCGSNGYQGYAGPPWRAQAMVSLLTAFRSRESQGTAPPQGVPLDHAELQAINQDADAINRDLRRVVWNGRLMADHQEGDALRLKAVLSQINQASVRTRRRVSLAIQDLATTSLARAQGQAHELSRLAADILDRNLYERANDCRWWALSPALVATLSQAGSGLDAGLNARLDHVNRLYTVYSRLAVFDLQGQLRGASHANARPEGLDRPVPQAWLTAVSGLHDSQAYAVSAFEDTALHDGGPTYTYLAAVRSADGRQVLGGIAIVFHAARELGGMLADVFGQREGFAAFVDAQGRVVASSDAACTQGLVVPPADQVIEHAESFYACASVAAGGYREFGREDGYHHGLRAVVGLRLGSTERRQTAYSDQELSGAQVGVDERPQHALALFQVGPGRYALPAADLMEAVSRQGLVPTPDQNALMLGMLTVGSGGRDELISVYCARRLFGVSYPSRASDGVVLVLRDPQHPQRPALGLWVDDVLTVLDFTAAQRHATPGGFTGFAPWVDSLFDARAQDLTGEQAVLIQSLSPLRLLNTLSPKLRAAAEALPATELSPAPEQETLAA